MPDRTAAEEAVDRQFRLLPSALEHIAATDPERVYAAAPKTSNLENGLQIFTFSKVLKAVNAFASYLEQNFGVSNKFETLTYLGVDDLRYAIFFFACIKTGYKVFALTHNGNSSVDPVKALFVSTRLAPQQFAPLAAIADCHHLFYAKQVAAVATDFAAASSGMQIHEVLPIDHWAAMDSETAPFAKSYEDARDDPVLVLHSSGSTGPPKLIIQTQQWILNQQKQYEGRPVMSLEPYDWSGGGYYLQAFPFFHLAGFYAACMLPVYTQSAGILIRPTDRATTPELLLDMMRLGKVRTLFVPPSIVEGLTRLPHGMEKLASLEYIVFSGGPLEKSVGDLLSQTAHVCSSYGTTETCQVLTYVPKTSEWQYLEFHPAHNVIFEEDADGMYELVLYQDKSGACNRPIDATILRTEPFWRSKDLFMHHPDKPHLWRYCGRKDDIVVFSTGQKWNPLPSEGLIQTRTEASGVLIDGTNRPEPAAFIETPEFDKDHAMLLDQVWPAVEEANSKTQRYGRISRSRIAFVQPGTFERTAKGTIVRKTTLAALQDTLNRLYDDDTNGREDLDPKQPLPDSITGLVRQAVYQIQTVRGINDNDDLFLAGLDSLESAQIARALKTQLRSYATSDALKFLDSSFVFQNSSVSWLADAAVARLSSVDHTTISKRHAATFASLFTKYKAALDANRPSISARATSFSKVAITGSTGSLGSHILRLLIGDSRILKVVCLNRSRKAASTTGPEDNNSRGDQEVSHLTVDFARSNLGLDQLDLQILAGVDVIIHCAWAVDFNRSLSTFEPQVRALVDLARTSLCGEQSPRLVFISSISVADGTCPEVSERHGQVPEMLVTEPRNRATRMGYAVSKNLGEHLLAYAAQQHKLPATVLRVGQIAGSTRPSDPSWTRKEWLPSLVDTSANLGYLPQDLTDVDWLPVDICAQTIVELAAHDVKCSSSDFLLYNVVNPNPTRWAPLAAAIQKHLPTRIEQVSLRKWVEELKQHDDGLEESLTTYPSLKLLPFFERQSSTRADEAVLLVSTSASCAASPTLARTSPIKEAHMNTWMKQWGYTENRSNGI